MSQLNGSAVSPCFHTYPPGPLLTHYLKLLLDSLSVFAQRTGKLGINFVASSPPELRSFFYLFFSLM